MPTPAIKKWSEMTKKSEKECERVWEQSKKEADKKFKTRDSHYWAYVTLTTKRKLGVEKIEKEKEKEAKAKKSKKKSSNESGSYDPDHKCLTPDAIYSSKIGGNTVSMSVKLPFDLDLDSDESEALEADLHYAFEKVLSKLFKDK